MNRILPFFAMPTGIRQRGMSKALASYSAPWLVLVGMCVGCAEVTQEPSATTDADVPANHAAEPAASIAAPPDPGSAAGEGAGDTTAQPGQAAPVAPPDADVPLDEPSLEPRIPQRPNESQAEFPAEAPPSEARQPTGRSDPLDLAELLIDSAPIPSAPLTPELEMQLGQVRNAIRTRDFATSGQHLQAADPLRRTAADEQAYERMLLVHALWAQGWSHAAAAARELSPGDSLETWAGPAVVQDKTEREVTLRIDGKPRTLSLALGDMEVRLAAAIVRHRARKTGLALDAQVAALWTFAPQESGGEERTGSLSHAREAIIEAMQRGAYVDHVIAELQQLDRADTAE